MKPEELLYAKTHEWAYVTEDGGEQIATIGISAFAVQQLTDLVYIELPECGSSVKAGDSMGEIESVKAVSDLYSPVTGEVVEVNEPLRDALEMFSEDPYQAGWIAKVKVSDPESLKALMDYAAYQKQCTEES